MEVQCQTETYSYTTYCEDIEEAVYIKGPIVFQQAVSFRSVRSEPYPEPAWTIIDEALLRQEVQPPRDAST